MSHAEARVRRHAEVARGGPGEAWVVLVLLEELECEGGVTALREDALLVEQREEALAWRAEELQHGLVGDSLRVEGVCRDALSEVLLLRCVEDDLVEDGLQLLIGVVDEQLLEAWLRVRVGVRVSGQGQGQGW